MAFEDVGICNAVIAVTTRCSQRSAVVIHKDLLDCHPFALAKARNDGPQEIDSAMIVFYIS